MERENKPRWMALCEEASTEQDGKKLLKLVREIVALLENKEDAKPPKPS